MPYTTTPCPNCGADVKLDENLETGYCMFCGSQIRLDTESKSVRNMLVNLRRDIMEGRNKTDEFKYRLWDALNHSPHNKELINYNKSEIWNATVCDDELITVHGDMKTFVVPSFIKTIDENAFWGCNNLRDVTLPKSVVFIDNDIFEDNSKITMYTTSNSCAAKYAAIHSIILHTKSKNATYTISEDISELRKLRNSILEIKDSGTDTIRKHYDNIKKQALAPNMLSKLLPIILVAGNVWFLADVTIFSRINYILLILVNLPLILAFTTNKGSKKLEIFNKYRNHDIAFWGTMFNIRFNKSYRGTPIDNRYWNLEDKQIKDEISQLNITLHELKTLDPKRYINLKNYNKAMLRVMPTKLGLPMYNTDKNIPSILNDFNHGVKKYEVRLDESQVFSREKAKLINKYTGITVLKCSSYYSFVDKKAISRLTGVPESVISDMFNGRLELTSDMRRAIYIGYKQVKLCATLGEAQMVAAQINYILGDVAKIYKDNKALNE